MILRDYQRLFPLQKGLDINCVVYNKRTKENYNTTKSLVVA